MLKFKRLAVAGLFLLALVPVGVLANAPQPGANGYTNENPNKNIVPKQNNGYAPPNVQEAQKREAERKKEAQDKKEASEKKIEKDKNYQSIEDKAASVDQVLEKEGASSKELEQAGENMEVIKQYIADHPEEETDGSDSRLEDHSS